jgi:hypothetical protein
MYIRVSSLQFDEKADSRIADQTLVVWELTSRA